MQPILCTDINWLLMNLILLLKLKPSGETAETKIYFCSFMEKKIRVVFFKNSNALIEMLLKMKVAD